MVTRLFLLGLLLVSHILCFPLAAQEELLDEEELEEVQEKVEELSSQLEENKEKLRHKRTQKRQTEASIGKLTRELRYTELKLKRARKDYDYLKVKIKHTQTDMEEAHKEYQVKRDQFENRIREIYKTKNLGFLDFVFSPTNNTIVLDNIYVFEKIIQTDIRLVKDIKDKYDQLTLRQQELEDQQQEINRLRSSITKRESLIKRQRQTKKKFLTSLSRQIQEIERQNEELERASNEIQQFIMRRTAGELKFFGTGDFLKPVKGWLSSRFGMRLHPISKRHIMHRGIDLAAPKGYKIRAADSGIVEVAGQKEEYRGYGILTIINHGYNPKIKKRVTTVYAHQSRLFVKEGDFVKKGDVIGWVGSTGYSTGPHLHFELRHDGVPVNPLDHVNF